MIALFTDFGWQGPYVGQMKAAIRSRLPNIPVIDLMHDVPAFDPIVASYLLAALAEDFPAETIFVAVIDPGVGHPSRRPYMVQADGQWFVGPDNGLFDVIESRATDVQRYEILWQPEKLSSSFHGRDLFAPVAAMLSQWEIPEHQLMKQRELNLDSDLSQVIYIDHFGNAMTGIQGIGVFEEQKMVVNNTEIAFAQTFSMVPEGQLFWYVNSSGLVEISANKGSAAEKLDLVIGSEIQVS